MGDRVAPRPAGTAGPAGRVDLLLLLMAAMWGTNFSVIKIGLVDVPPLPFAALRLALASVMMIALARLAGASLRLPRRAWGAIVGLGLVGNTLYQVCFVYGADRTSADNASLILATVPVFVALLGSVLGLERIAPWGWAGVGLSLAGIVFIVVGGDPDASPEFGGPGLAGDALVLLSTLAWSGYTLWMRRVVREWPAVAVTVGSTVAGSLPLLLLSARELGPAVLGPVSARGWLAVIASALIGICLPYFIWNHGISRLGSARTSLYSYLVPPFALVVAWIWLGETLAPLQFVGGVLALAGVLLSRRHVHPIESG